MKIAIFASAFHPHAGGVEELCRQLAHAYGRVGHKVVIITNRWPRDLPAVEDFEGIEVRRFALRSPGEDLKSRASFALTSALIQRQVDELLRKKRIEVVHIQCVNASSFYVLRSCKKLGLPLVVTTQGERTMDAAQIFQKNVWMQKVLRDCLSKACYITACSRDTLLDVEHFYGRPFGERAQVVYNGIRIADFEGVAPYSQQRPYILGIGRMVPQKGFDLLLRAFAASDCTDHDLLLAGDGDELEALKSLAHELGITERTHFFGRAERSQAVALFKGCSFFVLPSRREPQGIVNLEAMCAGKAVIAAKVGGVPEIVIDGETGLLFIGENVEILAHHITELAFDVKQRDGLGAVGRKRALSFDWDEISKQYLEIYERVKAMAPTSP